MIVKTPIVVTIAENKKLKIVTDNHSTYAKNNEYKHIVYEVPFNDSPLLRAIFKWQFIYDVLVENVGCSVLFLSENSIIYKDYRIEDVFTNYDTFTNSYPTLENFANISLLYFSGSNHSINTALEISRNLRVAYSSFNYSKIKYDQNCYEPTVIAKFLNTDNSNTKINNKFYISSYIEWAKGNLKGFRVLSSPFNSFICTAGIYYVENLDQSIYKQPRDYRIVEVIASDKLSGYQLLSNLYIRHEELMNSPNNHDIHINNNSDIAIISLCTKNVEIYAEIHQKCFE